MEGNISVKFGGCMSYSLKVTHDTKSLYHTKVIRGSNSIIIKKRRSTLLTMTFDSNVPPMRSVHGLQLVIICAKAFSKSIHAYNSNREVTKFDLWLTCRNCPHCTLSSRADHLFHSISKYIHAYKSYTVDTILTWPLTCDLYLWQTYTSNAHCKLSPFVPKQFKIQPPI